MSPPAKCIAAAVNVGKGKVAIPTKTVRPLCKFYISFWRISPCIEIANVTRDRLMHQIIPRTIFACVGIQGLNVQQHQVRWSASLYVSVGYWV